MTFLSSQTEGGGYRNKTQTREGKKWASSGDGTQIMSSSSLKTDMKTSNCPVVLSTSTCYKSCVNFVERFSVVENIFEEFSNKIELLSLDSSRSTSFRSRVTLDLMTPLSLSKLSVSVSEVQRSGQFNDRPGVYLKGTVKARDVLLSGRVSFTLNDFLSRTWLFDRDNDNSLWREDGSERVIDRQTERGGNNYGSFLESIQEEWSLRMSN